eukprot:3352339-Pleurochrysis_carterae.AAC.2
MCIRDSPKEPRRQVRNRTRPSPFDVEQRHVIDRGHTSDRRLAFAQDHGADGLAVVLARGGSLLRPALLRVAQRAGAPLDDRAWVRRVEDVAHVDGDAVLDARTHRGRVEDLREKSREKAGKWLLFLFFLGGGASKDGNRKRE